MIRPIVDRAVEDRTERGVLSHLRLARSASEISVGEVVRHTEGGFDLVDCSSCLIAPACALTAALHEARSAFMTVLDGYSLASLVEDRKGGLRELLASFEKESAAGVA